MSNFMNHENKNIDFKKSTPEIFDEKWNRWNDLLFDTEVASRSGILDWILTRNGWKDLAGLANFLKSKDSILDAGCGNGRITSLLSKLAPDETKIYGWDINEEVAKKNLKSLKNVLVNKVDLSLDELPSNKFDFIYCQEVLHHLPNPKKSFDNLTKLLNSDGIISIYVYGLKNPIREFTDEWIRGIFQDISDIDKENLVTGITNVGRQLSNSDLTIEVSGLEALGLKTGNYKIQKFIYDYILKCFWNESLGIDGSKAINFDWFAPSLATKHTQQEIENWFHESGLTIVHSFVDEYGITAHGKK